MTSCMQCLPNMVMNIKFEGVSLLQVRIERPRSSVSGYSMNVLDMFDQIGSKVAYNGPVFVTVPIYDRLGPYLSLH